MDDFEYYDRWREAHPDATDSDWIQHCVDITYFPEKKEKFE
jgi:hypothetical protein